MDVNPRKFPRQARARATVEAIVVATAQLLTDHGFEALTTAEVAERAGVSIGSLYQYFPNKQALAAAVVDHYGEQFADAFVEALGARAPATLAESVDAMIHATLVAHPHEPALHRAMIELAPRVGRVERTREVANRIAGEITAELTRHRREIAPDLDLADAAALIQLVLETVSHRALQHHPVSLAGEGMVRQCRRLIIAYLTSPSMG
ncbi:MAG TPA: TetR/AcrR family transcriptional regulator [Hyphomicrobiales bacterium]|nr:TetR/AcrR family transcriptional regulator [Hyphomicrobiales bacterium]